MFDAEGLQRLHARLEQQVEAGFAPGVVGLVAHGPDVETLALGKTAFGGADVRRDTIFRIGSMTKAITATAVMMLAEEGAFRLDEPVDRLLPELADRRVLRGLDSELDDTVPAERAITVEDLLTFRCGIGLVPAPPGRYPIQRAIVERGVVVIGPPDPANPFDDDEWMRRLGSLPLVARPGEGWLYGTGSNVQGVLVARASGVPLSRFFEERIFGPLGMKDTGFVVPPAEIDRLAHAYRVQDGELVVSDEPATGRWSRPPSFEPGAGGLVSTVDDYLAFARMLLADGEHEGRALLAPASVEAMRTDRLTAEQRAGGAMILGPGRGWGYGMSVVTESVPGQPAPGTFGWIGGFGTSWISDPAADLTAILMTQHEFTSPSGGPIYQEFQEDAYAALG